MAGRSREWESTVERSLAPFVSGGKGKKKKRQRTDANRRVLERRVERAVFLLTHRPPGQSQTWREGEH